MHGRNAETWEKKGLKSASERFNYKYTRDELRDFVEPVRDVAQQAEEAHVTFNNNYEDYPQVNAKAFAGMLEKAIREAACSGSLLADTYIAGRDGARWAQPGTLARDREGRGVPERASERIVVEIHEQLRIPAEEVAQCRGAR